MTPPDEARDALARALRWHRTEHPDGDYTGHSPEPETVLSRLAASGWVVVPSGEVERLRKAVDDARATLDLIAADAEYRVAALNNDDPVRDG